MIVPQLDMRLRERKMSCMELASRIGCTQQTVSRIKQGKIKQIPMETLNSLCELFGCQPGDLYEYVPDGSEADPAGR